MSFVVVIPRKIVVEAPALSSSFLGTLNERVGTAMDLVVIKVSQQLPRLM